MTDNYFVHEKAICECTKIGKKTKIWAFAHILPKAQIGSNCNICDNVFIENNVVIGDNVTIKCGVQLWDGVEVEDDVFIGPNATFTNDLFPRSKKYPDKYLITVIRKGASIGANATILPSIVIGQYAMIGAGSVVTQNVPPYAVVAGNPAKIINYANDKKVKRNKLTTISDLLASNTDSAHKVITLEVNKCTLWWQPSFEDMRGNITINEFTNNLPFKPKRCFFVYGVTNNKIRGEHAHKACEQFLIAVKGKLHAIVDDGTKREEIILDTPKFGLYMPAKTWGIQYKFSLDAVLCVFASHKYRADDYIRDYPEFLQYVKNKNKK